MIRKQLSITEEQERLLKQRVAATGASESEIVRRALDAAFADSGTSRGADPARATAVEAWSAGADEVTRRYRPTARGEDGRRTWTRAGLHEEREARLSERVET